MAARTRAATPIGSCPDCLSWGASYGSQSFCRACYDFTRRYGRGQCAGCRRVIAVKKGHCRLCWLQAGIAAAGRRRLTPQDFTGTRYWQLSLAGMSRLGSTGPARQAPPEDPAPPPPAPGWTQLQLSVPGESLHFDKRHWAASAITGPALQQARHIAAGLADARGWNVRIITETSRALAVVLAECQPGDMIAWSQLPAALHRRDLSITRTAEILGLAGLLDDDRVPSFTSLAQERLALLPAPMAAGVRDWLRTRSQGGPRSRPRDEHTVRMNLNRVHPLLLAWAGHYVHLREVTAADVIAATEPLHGSLRRQTLTALRSLFGHANKTGTIFRDPTRGVRDGQRPLILIQPLQPAEIDQAASAALTPAARLAVALAAIHAARPKTIRELHLGDIDLGNRRLVIAGRARPLDDLTASLLLAWLQHRRQRWPGTANTHLILNQQTAMTTRAVSENWLTQSCRGLTATLERLRVDRQLEEALTCGADPLHLAAVFGIDDTTAIKYAAIARQLQETAAEQHPQAPANPRTQTACRA
jgi:site-specific recombinase XerD